jgi:hypothetical protein
MATVEGLYSTPCLKRVWILQDILLAAKGLLPFFI